MKTPEIVEADSLEETGRGDKGFGSTGLNSTEQKIISQSSDEKSDQINTANQSSDSTPKTENVRSSLKMNQSRILLNDPKHRRRDN